MKETALVIMAAGIGSRFGGGIKQLEPVGPGGEIIMDYSIYDALEAGFDKIIFIIRKDLEKDFREVIGNRIEKIAKVEYAFQELADLPAGFSVPEGRKKPWGTGQAVLSTKGLITGPFLVINADDYYGKEGFRKIHDYMVNEMDENGEVYDCLLYTSNILPKHWAGLAERIEEASREYTGIVVIHGTDTMAYTASMLSFMLWGVPVPVVITGSQLSISHPVADAMENCRAAIHMANSRCPGVFVAFNRKIMLGVRASKVRTMSFDAFDLSLIHI